MRWSAQNRQIKVWPDGGEPARTSSAVTPSYAG